jgi:hypothetical protein
MAIPECTRREPELLPVEGTESGHLSRCIRAAEV